MNKIILIGGGGHCKSVIDVIEQENKFEIAGIIDKPELLNSKILGYPIIGNDSDLKSLAEKYQYAIITVGQIKHSSTRIKLYNLAIEARFTLPSIVSPHAYVSKHSLVGKGTVVMHGATINSNSIIGNNCIINSCSLIEHEVDIGDNCHISTGAIINGQSKIGNETFVGSGSIVKNGVCISKKKIISFGSVVSKDLE